MIMPKFHRRYHVVAFSMPIVYTLEGDHDPNGMAYILKPIATLLKWAKERWNDGDRLLPRLHVRRQRVQLVIDGLERLDVMLDRLRRGSDADQVLLAELLRREELPDYLEAEDRLSHGARYTSGRAMAVRLNVQNQIDALRIALTDLEDVDGPNSWNHPVPPREGAAEGAEPEELDPATAPSPIRLVTLTSAQRRAWRAEWIAQAKLLDHALEQWFTYYEADSKRCFNAQQLSEESKIPQKWVQRLLLNDHKPGTDRGNLYDRFNPMKPIPALRPLALRCCHGETVEIEFENRCDRVRSDFTSRVAACPRPKGLAFSMPMARRSGEIEIAPAPPKNPESSTTTPNTKAFGRSTIWQTCGVVKKGRTLTVYLGH